VGGIHRVTVRAHTGFGWCYRSSSPRWNPRGSLGLPRGSDRVASALRLWLRSLSTRRGSTRTPASARVQVKLAATMCAFASSLVTSHRVEPKLRPTFDAPLASESSIRLRGRPGLPVRTRRLGPHSFGRALRERKRSRSVRALGGFAPQKHPRLLAIRESSTSRCGNTLKWHPRTGEVVRSFCLHLERSVRRSKNLKADFC
jgi:hypothetical protein